MRFLNLHISQACQNRFQSRLIQQHTVYSEVKILASNERQDFRETVLAHENPAPLTCEHTEKASENASEAFSVCSVIVS